FIVFDRVETLKPNYKVELRFQLHGRGAPTIAGNLATSVVGASALHLRTLLPRAPSVTVAWNMAGADKVSPRIAVAAGAPGTVLDALDVITVGDARAAAPSATLVTADG